MFAPVLDDDEEEEFHPHVPPQGGRLAWGAMIARVVKINNILLLLSLGVATFIQFSTLEPRYVNTLMWGEPQLQQEQHFNDTIFESVEAPLLSAPSTTAIVLRSLQSLSAILMLTFLRTITTRHDNWKRRTKRKRHVPSSLGNWLICLLHHSLDSL
jgi:hypothetical protein